MLYILHNAKLIPLETLGVHPELLWPLMRVGSTHPFPLTATYLVKVILGEPNRLAKIHPKGASRSDRAGIVDQRGQRESCCMTRKDCLRSMSNAVAMRSFYIQCPCCEEIHRHGLVVLSRLASWARIMIHDSLCESLAPALLSTQFSRTLNLAKNITWREIFSTRHALSHVPVVNAAF